MATRLADATSTRELFSADPLPLLVVGALPVCLAIAQLGLAVSTGSSLGPSAAFTLVLVVFAWVATGHQGAVLRRREIEKRVHDR